MTPGVEGGPARAARPPTGHSRKSFGHFDGAIAAGTFAGMGERAAHPKHLLEPLRQLGAHLPFPREALATLSLLFDYSRPEQWREGGRPLVYPGNAELAGCLGVSERTVRNHLRALQAAGVIHVERGPGNRRTPIRDGRGAVIEPYGIDLAPLAAAAARFTRLAEELRLRRLRLKERMRAISVAVQEIRTAFDALDIVAAETPDRPSLAVAAGRLRDWLADAEERYAESRRAVERDPLLADDHEANESRLAALADALTRRAGEANLLSFEELSNLENHQSSGQAETSFHQKTTKENPSPYSAPQSDVSGFSPPARQPTLVSFDRPSRPSQPVTDDMVVTARQAVAVFPPLADLMRDYLLLAEPAEARPGEVIDAARILALRMGLSEWAWRTGCERHGRGRCAMAAILAAAKPAAEIKVGRSAFLAGVLLREPNQMNVLASWHALRKRLAAADRERPT
ncbi:MAG: HTH domain-containing protein [Alphaproteobacteria bacterium]|nr:HTH domain-containing protein [Alphaproteobacteria bacterium]